MAADRLILGLDPRPSSCDPSQRICGLDPRVLIKLTVFKLLSRGFVCVLVLTGVKQRIHRCILLGFDHRVLIAVARVNTACGLRLWSCLVMVVLR